MPRLASADCPGERPKVLNEDNLDRVAQSTLNSSCQKKKFLFNMSLRNQDILVGL